MSVKLIGMSIDPSEDDISMTPSTAHAATTSSALIPEIELQTPEKASVQPKRTADDIRETLFLAPKKITREIEEISPSASTIKEKNKLDRIFFAASLTLFTYLFKKNADTPKTENELKALAAKRAAAAKLKRDVDKAAAKGTSTPAVRPPKAPTNNQPASSKGKAASSPQASQSSCRSSARIRLNNKNSGK